VSGFEESKILDPHASLSHEVRKASLGLVGVIIGDHMEVKPALGTSVIHGWVSNERTIRLS
jgi:hypothetical protein